MDNLQNKNNKEQNKHEEKKVIISFSLKDVFLLMLIGLMVSNVWKCLEWIIYKELKPNSVDSIVAIILTYSIFLNCKYKELRKKQ